MFFCDIILRCVSSALAFWLIHQLPVWQPLNSSSAGGGEIPNIQDEISEERGRAGTHVSGWPAELSYRCYDLSSCLFPLVFSASRFPFALGALGDFIVLFSFFYSSFLHFFPFGWWYLSYCQAGGLEHVFVCIRASGDKWRRVFTPWFWSALVEEVAAWVRVVWPRSPYWTPSLINMQHSGRFVWTWLDCFNWME